MPEKPREEWRDDIKGPWLKIADEIHGLILSEADEKLAMDLLAQARKLRKVCPNESCRKGFMPVECSEGNSECSGTGTLPVEAGDVEVRVKK